MKFTSTRFTRAAAAATLTVAVTAGAAAAPANAWENTYQTYEEAGNEEGMCTLEFTAKERDDINAAYKLLFETMADVSADKLDDRENADTWYKWAKENPEKDPLAWHLGTKYKGKDVGEAQRKLATIKIGQNSGPYHMAGTYLRQSREPVLKEQTLKITPNKAGEMKGAGAVNTGGLVVPALWGLISGSVKLGDAAGMAQEALKTLGPRIQPTIKSYEDALTACEKRETTKGTIKEGSSLDTDQFIGAVAGGVLGLIALLGLIAVAVGPLVNDFFTNFWKNVGVLR